MFIKLRKMYSWVMVFTLVALLSFAPTQKVYASDVAFGSNNSINSIMVTTVGTVIGLLSAIGFSTANAGYQAYEENVVQPIVKHLKKYEVSNGKMKAYYKDGKTYVDKEVVQDVVDFASSKNMFTNIRNSENGMEYGKYLDADGIMDIESFFMAVPYFAQFNQKYPSKMNDFKQYMGIPYYYYYVNNDGNTSYFMGVISPSRDFKYFRFNEPEKNYFSVSFYNSFYEQVGSGKYNDCYRGAKISINKNGSVSYSSSYPVPLYSAFTGSVREFGYRIGLTKQIISEPSYTVADPAIAGQQIDNWNPAWAQNVIDVLKDLDINTSIDAGAVAGADADRRGLALPVTLPQYGIDARTDTEAWQRTADIGMDIAQTGEVALSADAVAELSQAIAQATGEAVHEAVGDISVSIPEAKYGGLDDYKLVLTDVFPFCIPFDLIDLVKVFSAEPEAPKFSMPIKYPTGYDSWDSYDLEIDLSVFDGVAKIVRVLETVLFILGLIKITRSAMIRG